jgi:hypothetical protein
MASAIWTLSASSARQEPEIAKTNKSKNPRRNITAPSQILVGFILLRNRPEWVTSSHFQYGK